LSHFHKAHFAVVKGCLEGRKEDNKGQQSLLAPSLFLLLALSYALIDTHLGTPWDVEDLIMTRGGHSMSSLHDCTHSMLLPR
jgi:hypothetical protein